MCKTHLCLCLLREQSFVDLTADPVPRLSDLLAPTAQRHGDRTFKPHEAHCR
jgi:hypothetical protein